MSGQQGTCGPCLGFATCPFKFILWVSLKHSSLVTFPCNVSLVALIQTRAPQHRGCFSDEQVNTLPPLPLQRQVPTSLSQRGCWGWGERLPSPAVQGCKPLMTPSPLFCKNLILCLQVVLWVSFSEPGMGATPKAFLLPRQMILEA